MLITKAEFGKYCVIKSKLDGDTFEKLSSLPGFKRWIGRDLLFDPTGANIERINKFFPNAEWDDSAAPSLEKYIDNLKAMEETLKIKEAELPTNDDYNFKTKPFDHQRKAFYMSRDKKSFALLMEQGTGKTKVIIDNASYLYSQGKITSLVVIAPNGVHRNWLREINTHMPEWCLNKSFYYSSNMTKARIAEFDEVYTAENCLKIFTFNVEAFTSPKAIYYMNKILLANKVMLVVDESSRIKRPGAKRTKIITKFSKQADYKRIMTGTPVTKGAEDVYSQFRFLDSQILGYDSFYSFKARYCIMGGFENRQVVSYQNIEELTRNIEGHSFRVLKKDCLDLPDKIYQRHYVEMTPKQKQIYQNLKKSFVAELEGQTIEAPEAITRLLRLQQILCGWFPGEEGVEKIEDKNPRIEALKDILSDIDSKVIIWARFKADLRAIERALGDLAVSYHGDVTTDAREVAVDRFQNDPKIKYFIGQPQSGGIGLTLTAADYAIYYSNSFDLEQRMQSEDRCHRIGTKNNVTYIDIETRGSVDTKIIKALRSKKNIADIITKDPASIFMEEDDE
jgi:SNF2 family DNA or RNA helicase